MEKADTKETPAPSGGATIQISADELGGLATKISELDTKIASASGSDTAAKKAFVEGLVAQNADQVNSSVDGLIEQLRAVEPAVLAGMVARLEERIKADLEPTVNEFVDAEFAKQQPADKADVGALREQRKELFTQFRALREVLGTFKIDTSHIPDPKRSGGGRPAGSGGGGSRRSGENKEGYRYLIDGKGRPPSQNTFSSLAFYGTIGVPKAVNPSDTTERWGAPQLKDFIKEKGVNFPEDVTWEVDLPNGKKIGARKMTEQDRAEFGLNVEPTPTETEAAETAAA